MTRVTGPDCAVMCNLINIHTHTHTLVGHGVRENSTSCDCAEIRTTSQRQKASRLLPNEPPGGPVQNILIIIDIYNYL